MSDIEIRGRPPSDQNLFWRQTLEEIRKNSVKTIEETARQIIGLVTLLSGLYFSAIAFGQVPQAYTDVKILFVGPLALWVLTLLAATLVFFPFPAQVKRHDPAHIEQVITKMITWKYRFLWIALILLIISLGWLTAAAWMYLGFYVVR